MKVKICVIAGILLIGTVFFGCVINKGVTETGVKITAKGTSEGVKLSFENIPKDAKYVIVGLADINADNRPENVIVLSDDSLDALKKTGNLLCPFVKKGHKYYITVYVNTSYSEAFEKHTANAIAGGGIYLTNSPELNFTNENNTLALSEMPVFSEKVFFSKRALFDYSVYVRVDPVLINNDGTYIGGGGEETNRLRSDSVWSTTAAIKEGVADKYSYVFSGDMPVFGTVHCLLDYGNNEWIVAVAQSKDVIVSF